MKVTVIEQAEAIREAMDIAGATLTDEKALECVRLYRPYEVGKEYKTGDFFTYGVNGVGDPQLYKVAQEHTSQSDWKPDTAPALYTAIGLDDSGYPVWAQPTGAHDAYNKGDVVNYNGVLYESLIDGNVYSPEAYPAGWAIYSE
jgi:hypothetical protein